MAKKNHALDEKIVQAARKEFLTYGFEKASLHEIAKKANTTTGAIYTRYKGKDDLFLSLVQDIMDTTKLYMPEMNEAYEQVRQSKDVNAFLSAIRSEFHLYQDLLEHHYEACYLFYCRSQGSSLETMLKQMMDAKTQSTVEFFRSISDTDMDLDGIGILMMDQFHFFKAILEKGYDKEKTIRCMQVVEKYQEAGWKEIFETIL